MAEGMRAIRMAALMQEELGSMLGTELSDPRVKNVIVSRVELTSDLSSAKVFIRLMDLTSEKEAQDRAIAGLTSASGLLRREIGTRLNLRHAPQLRFIYDKGQDAAMRIEELLDGIKKGQ